ncbi:MAG: hypothetical protein ACPKPY_08105 [Nitrososphaeraceae archaeon]
MKNDKKKQLPVIKYKGYTIYGIPSETSNKTFMDCINDLIRIKLNLKPNKKT